MSFNLTGKQKERCDHLLGIQNQAFNLFLKKNKDYGDAFATYGVIGVLVRIGDKISRLMNIEKNKIALSNDETMKDTLLDLHNYAAMALMLINDNNYEMNKYTPNSPNKLPDNI